MTRPSTLWMTAVVAITLFRCVNAMGDVSDLTLSERYQGQRNQTYRPVPAHANANADAAVSVNDALCGGDLSLPVKCFQKNDAPKYLASQAVARVTVHGGITCTGVLVGDQKNALYLLTAARCFPDDKSIATATIEFGAESTSCKDQCYTFLGCKGPDVFSGSELLTMNRRLDYAILELNTGGRDREIAEKYGFVRLSRSGPQVDDVVYIPHHAQGSAKRISFKSKFLGGITKIQPFVDLPLCPTKSPKSRISFATSGMGNAWGAPVMTSRAIMVAMNVCGGCDTKNVHLGLSSKTILVDLDNKAVPISNFAAT